MSICVGFVSDLCRFVSDVCRLVSDSIAHAIERFAGWRVSKSPSTPKASSWDVLVLQSPTMWPCGPLGEEVRESLVATLPAMQTRKIYVPF